MSEPEDSTEYSQLFMVRVWLEKVGDGKAEWRGKVLHVSSSEIGYFRDWQTMTGHMRTMLTGITSAVKAEKQ